MRFYHLKHYLFLFFLFGMGCAFYEKREPEPPLPAPSVQREDSQEDFQERSQKVRLQKAMVAWENMLTTIIDSLRAEIAENESIIEDCLKFF